MWLTVEQMGMLFDKEASNIRRHIINIFNEQELSRDNNVHFLHVNGVKKPVPFYSLDVIISVGYRVKSLKGTQFRIWANSILKQYLLKGYNIHPQLSVIQNQIIALQEHTDNRIQDIERHLERHDEQIDLYIKTNEPNKEQLFGNGCVFDAWSYISGFIRDSHLGSSVMRSRLILTDLSFYFIVLVAYN